MVEMERAGVVKSAVVVISVGRDDVVVVSLDCLVVVEKLRWITLLFAARVGAAIATCCCWSLSWEVVVVVVERRVVRVRRAVRLTFCEDCLVVGFACAAFFWLRIWERMVDLEFGLGWVLWVVVVGP